MAAILLSYMYVTFTLKQLPCISNVSLHIILEACSTSRCRLTNSRFSHVVITEYGKLEYMAMRFALVA
jgi:hypothetical protein